jgi:hypothetical protein
MGSHAQVFSKPKLKEEYELSDVPENCEGLPSTITEKRSPLNPKRVHMARLKPQK